MKFLISLYKKMRAIASLIVFLSAIGLVFAASTVTGAIVNHFAGLLPGVIVTFASSYIWLRLWLRWFFSQATK